jgi:hypothetical protein
MSAGDIAEYIGMLMGAWSLGFTGGYLLTKFRDAMNATL